MDHVPQETAIFQMLLRHKMNPQTANLLYSKARDHARTPMQWDASPNAGFCPAEVTPWMRVIDDYKTVNTTAQVDFQSDTELSPWQWWQRALADRKEHKAVFVYGDFEDVSADHDKVYAYLRTSSKNAKERWIVALNFSGVEQGTWALPEGVEVETWVASTYEKDKADGKAVTGNVVLQPWEGLLGRVKAS